MPDTIIQQTTLHGQMTTSINEKTGENYYY
jgi:hypothetical protein